MERRDGCVLDPAPNACDGALTGQAVENQADKEAMKGPLRRWSKNHSAFSQPPQAIISPLQAWCWL